MFDAVKSLFADLTAEQIDAVLADCKAVAKEAKAAVKGAVAEDAKATLKEGMVVVCKFKEGEITGPVVAVREKTFSIEVNGKKVSRNFNSFLRVAE